MANWAPRTKGDHPSQLRGASLQDLADTPNPVSRDHDVLCDPSTQPRGMMRPACALNRVPSTSHAQEENTKELWSERCEKIGGLHLRSHIWDTEDRMHDGTSRASASESCLTTCTASSLQRPQQLLPRILGGLLVGSRLLQHDSITLSVRMGSPFCAQHHAK